MKLNFKAENFKKLNTALDKLNEATVEAKMTGNLNINKISEATSMAVEASEKEFKLTPSISVDTSLLEDEDWKDTSVSNAAYEVLHKFKDELMKKMFDKVISIEDYNFLNLIILPASIYVSNGSERAKLTIKRFFEDLKLDEEIKKIKSKSYLNAVKSKMGQKYYNDFVEIVIPEVEKLLCQ